MRNSAVAIGLRLQIFSYCPEKSQIATKEKALEAAKTSDDINSLTTQIIELEAQLKALQDQLNERQAAAAEVDELPSR